MGLLTADQATRLDKSNPEFQRATPFEKLRILEAYAPVVLIVDITADATAEKAVPIPFAMEVLDVTVECRADNANGTLTLKKGATAVTNAIICAVDKTITRAGTIDDAQSTFAAGETVTVDAFGAADRGRMTIFGRRI